MLLSVTGNHTDSGVSYHSIFWVLATVPLKIQEHVPCWKSKSKLDDNSASYILLIKPLIHFISSSWNCLFHSITIADIVEDIYYIIVG